MTNTDFLPSDYKIPTKDKYMRWKEGVNRFRVLTSPILGWEYWNEEDGKRKPIRKRMNEDLIMGDIQEPDKVKHFWALVVWNYQEDLVQILEITQKGIQSSLRALAKSKDWGTPLGYDVEVTRTGEGFDTKYETQPMPKKALDKKIQAKFESMDINLEALFSGDDPFQEKLSENVKPEDIDI